MRDLWIHDSDLIVATHGRGFWILDDIAPLREVSAALANSVHLFAPAPAYRVQRDTNTDTPLPPDEPAAANPPDGAIVDYFLPSPANSVALDIFDAKGNFVRRYTNADKPDITDEELRAQLIPLYWVRPPAVLPPRRRHAPLGVGSALSCVSLNAPRLSDRGDSSRHATRATRPNGFAGSYSVRLTVDGKSMTAPLTVKIGPRVKTSASGLHRKFQTETRLASILNEVYEALAEANWIRLQLDAQTAQPKGQAQSAIGDFQKKVNALLEEARLHGASVRGHHP